MDALQELEALLGHRFGRRELLETALTHPSFSSEQADARHYQRLEFLGDAVLGLVLAETLFLELPDEREGVLTRYRAMLASGGQLSDLASDLGLGRFLRMGEAEASMGGRGRASILEDAFEALIGALYLDGGMAVARAFILSAYGDIRARVGRVVAGHNPKGKLQELLQPVHGNDAIRYLLVEEAGPDHCKAFTVEVSINGEVLGHGSGASKKAAEEAAAREALERLENG
jgi:ribonuclease-3